MESISQKSATRFWSKVDRAPGKGPNGDCWEWAACRQANGYGRFGIGSKVEHAHRVAYKLDTGIDPGEQFVCHRCDNRACCNPSHLYLATNAENIGDARRKGRFPSGDNHWSKRSPERLHRGRRLKPGKVREIRRYAANGEPTRKIARLFGVSRSLIRKIVTGAIWKELL